MNTLQSIKEAAEKKIQEAINAESLDEIRVSILGKKGELTQILKGMKDLSAEERPKVGQQVNEVRALLEDMLAEKKQALKHAMLTERLKKETIDVTLPGRRAIRGHRHPNQIALEDLERVFIGMGYEVVDGPEVEYDRYNFELLNIPANHPAKDEQDTFYITKDILLRTQTSSVQARIMEKGKLPIKIISPGRVFRSDE
ncbi:MAG: phenylalanine--tRNA ligase subunit alpha, partial [Eubacterium sp.]|nr:phenylalanine--tRNA ligase subunit alpha [Eubacterium sp.]